MTIQELADKADVTTRTIRYYVEQGVLPPPGYGRPAEYTEEHVQRLALIKKLKEQYLPLEEIRDTLQRLTLAEVEQLVSETAIPTQEVAQQQKLESASDYLNNVLGRGMVREQMKKRSFPAQDESEAMEQAPPARKPVAPGSGSGYAPRQEPDLYSDPDLMPPPPAPLVPPAMSPAPASSMAPGAPPPSPARERSVEADRSSIEGEATKSKKSAYMKSPATVSETEQSQDVERQSTTWERVNLGEGVELHIPTGASASLGGKVARLIEAARRILGHDPGNGD